jgi:hypothetical protein
MKCSPRKMEAMGMMYGGEVKPKKMAKGGCAVKGMKVGGPVRKMKLKAAGCTRIKVRAMQRRSSH